MIGWWKTGWDRVKRAFSVLRGFQGAETSRLHPSQPRNQSADSRALGPFGADSLRAWARKLVQDNPYAKSVVDTIAGWVVGSGITCESTYEPDGSNSSFADLNEIRLAVWKKWSKVCDLNGQLNFFEIQDLAIREIAEAGEVLIHFKTVPLVHKGIKRPVPLALEVIEADRLATEYDTYAISREGGRKIVRGVEMDEDGMPIAYWIYPEHPQGVYAHRRMPERIEANRIKHIFRRERVGQSRGVSWFAPVIGVLKDLGIYIENELQASAISACDMTLIKSETPLSGPDPGSGNDSSDDNGTPLEYYEPGRVYNLRPGEDVAHINPSRPNANAEPWIHTMAHQIASGTSTTYQSVSKDFTQANYSNSRMSRIDVKPHVRKWQNMIVDNLCQPTWEFFIEAAALAGLNGFPSMAQVEDDIDYCAPCEWHPPFMEYVDPDVEQKASENAIKAFQSTHQIEIGRRSGNYKRVFKQAAKERQERKAAGLLSVEEMKAEAELLKAQAALMTAQAAQKNADTNAETTERNDGFKPPQGVAEEAKQGLEWRKKYGRGGTEVGVARARDLANRRNVSLETINRMVSYFARHEVDKQGEGFSPGEDGFPSAGRIAWALWGGDAGKRWAESIQSRNRSEALA